MDIFLPAILKWLVVALASKQGRKAEVEGMFYTAHTHSDL